MTSDPSVEFSPRSEPAPLPWHDDAEPLDPNWTPPEPPETAPAWAPPPPPPGPGAAGGRPSRHWRFGPRSLTGRLVAGVVTLVVFLVLATGVGTYVALRSFLYNRLDQQVAQVADSDNGFVQRCLIGGQCNISAPSASGLQAPLVQWLTTIDATGKVILEPKEGIADLRSLRLSAAEARSIVSHPIANRTLTTADGTKLRVAVRTLQIGPQTFYLVTGLSVGDVQRTMHRLVILEWAIGGSAVLIALLATGYGVRFSLRRLYGVTQTAQEVASELSPEGKGLDRRVPIDESDTTEVGQLAESMNTLLSAVETQFAARLAHEEQMRQFLADASHELRTPLTSIRGFAELARMQREQGGSIEVPADNLERIESEGTRMSRLVDDLLTLARSDQGAEPRNEWIDVADLLDEAVSGVRAANPARRIDMNAEPTLAVIGDRDQLVRVVRNLVTNAAVHTRPDGPITVSASREGDWAVLRVADSGPGLPQEEAAHVFERFWRADKARTRARGGSGLGLAIVASIVQSHGGYVRFDSSVEQGSVVTVSLPVGTS